ncbi:hypothetical protein HDU97_005952 [Phlyctochytrium planicorne]|nr:hypothetical protein HDU97_005952 [Phlyctochytrium planicorne]
MEEGMHVINNALEWIQEHPYPPESSPVSNTATSPLPSLLRLCAVETPILSTFFLILLNRSQMDQTKVALALSGLNLFFDLHERAGPLCVETQVLSLVVGCSQSFHAKEEDKQGWEIKAQMLEWVVAVVGRVSKAIPQSIEASEDDDFKKSVTDTTVLAYEVLALVAKPYMNDTLPPEPDPPQSEWEIDDESELVTSIATSKIFIFTSCLWIIRQLVAADLGSFVDYTHIQSSYAPRDLLRVNTGKQ